MVAMQRLFCLFLAIIQLGLAAACQPPAPVASTSRRAIAPTPVTLAQQYLQRPGSCTGQFVTHTLDFATGTRIRTLRTYESNGAGVAVNDLDADGDLDLVMANIDGASIILWNQGELRFVTEPLAAQFTRAVAIVDVNGDGQLDIVFTHRGLATLSYWQNQGATATPRFSSGALPGVTTYAYSMGWGDVNHDGFLDLVAGSYNIDLKQQGMSKPEENEHAGVMYYEQTGDTFSAQRLSGRSEALAIGLLDLDDDGQRGVAAQSTGLATAP
jgi:enediyne biosynthesis protein E4